MPQKGRTVCRALVSLILLKTSMKQFSFYSHQLFKKTIFLMICVGKIVFETYFTIWQYNLNCIL